MSDDDAFVRAILSAPSDDNTRLVYADWLQDREDIRAEYLRTELLLSKTRKKAERRTHRLRLQELRQKIDPAWLAIFDQPKLMRANPTPFPAAWLSTDLGDYREADGTYEQYRYDSVPPLPTDLFRGQFDWLSTANQERIPLQTGRCQSVIEQAAEFDLRLPDEFVIWMEYEDLQEGIRSGTDCFFDLARRIVESPLGEGGHLVRFYSDSQGCLHWYLYLTPLGYHCVVVSPDRLGGGWYDDDLELEEEEMYEEFEEEADHQEKFWFCAPSFESFLYRWWIENEIWYSLCFDHDPLTPAEERYLDHYRK